MDTRQYGCGGCCACIFIILLALKLSGQADISWWLVTLPLWSGIVVLSCILSSFGTAVGVAVANAPKNDPKSL